MRVAEVMSTSVASLGPQHTLRDALSCMVGRGIGSVVVHDPEAGGWALVAERDLLRAVAAGVDLDSAVLADHTSDDAVTGAPAWPLETAAETMLRQGFRHLVVTDGTGVAGVLSLRDIAAGWVRERQEQARQAAEAVRLDEQPRTAVLDLDETPVAGV